MQVKHIMSRIIAMFIVVVFCLSGIPVYAQETDSNMFATEISGELTTKGQLLDVQYFSVNGEEVRFSDSPETNLNIAKTQSNNLMTGSISFYYKGLDSKNRPKYSVVAKIYSSKLTIKSSNLKTKPQGNSSYSDHKVNHSGTTAINTYTYVYTTSNPPSNPYCEVKLYVTDSEGFETYIGYTKLTNAIK